MNNRQIVTSLLFAFVALLTACDQPVEPKQAVTSPLLSPQTEPSSAAASVTLYVNADVVTVDDSNPSAQALAVRDGRILAVGSRQEVELVAGEGADIRDMQGKTIVPGLIDAHGHISLTAMSQGFANIQPPPAGPVASIAQLQQSLKDWDEAHPDMPWILGWGYDDSLLAEGRHPSRYDLDAVSTEKPVVLSHVSGHLMACNSKCLEMTGIDASSEDPPGGVYQRVEGSQTPNGVLEESAIYKVYAMLPRGSEEQRVFMLEQAQTYYARHGITTLLS